MFDRVKAHEDGLVVSCDASLAAPMTSSAYWCAVGHLHIVYYKDGIAAISPFGYDPAFYAALIRADDAGRSAGHEGSHAYAHAYAASLAADGYGVYVVLN